MEDPIESKSRHLSRSRVTQCRLGGLIILLGLLALCFSVALCLKTYVTCRFGDEW